MCMRKTEGVGFSIVNSKQVSSYTRKTSHTVTCTSLKMCYSIVIGAVSNETDPCDVHVVASKRSHVSYRQLGFILN